MGRLKKINSTGPYTSLSGKGPSVNITGRKSHGIQGPGRSDNGTRSLAVAGCTRKKSYH